MLDRIVLCVAWLHNLKHQTDLIMDVPNATTTTTTLTESARRTNVLLVELDRPPIPHSLACSSVVLDYNIIIINSSIFRKTNIIEFDIV